MDIDGLTIKWIGEDVFINQSNINRNNLNEQCIDECISCIRWTNVKCLDK